MSKFLVQSEVELNWDVVEDIIVISAEDKPVMKLFLGEAMEANPEFVKQHVNECVNTEWLPKWKELFPPTMTKDDLIETTKEYNNAAQKLFEALGKLNALYDWASAEYESHRSGTMMSMHESMHGEIIFGALKNKIHNLMVG